MFFEEEFIKQNEKLPNKIKLSLEKSNVEDSDWDDKKKLNVLINNCINIENNIKDINIINEKIQKYKLISDKDEINFVTDDNEIENFKKLIKSFGKIESLQIFENSLIIKNNNVYRHNLKQWINANKKFTTSLLYRKTENDDSYSTFHKLCDNKGITLTLIKRKEGFIIGGYTPLNWGTTLAGLRTKKLLFFLCLKEKFLEN